MSMISMEQCTEVKIQWEVTGPDSDDTASDTDWSDSESLVITYRVSAGRPTALFLLSVRTGEKRQLTFPPSGVLGGHCPAVSPDGRTLAFRRANAESDWRGKIYLLGLDSEFKP
jgi:hypothetical protein